MEWLEAVIFVVVVSAVAVGGLLVARRRVDHAALAKHNDVGGVVFSIVGTIYAVVLAFVVVVTWEALGDADERAAQEAGVLGDVIRDVGFFPDPVQTELKQELLEYTHAVIDEEWPAMAAGSGGSSPHVWETVDRIFDTFARIDPTTQRESNVHAEMLSRLNDLSDHRRLRLLSADNKIPPLMWIMLATGGFITVGFSYFLGVENHRSHLLMTAALAAMIGITLYLIFALDHPFAGAVRVEPDAFRLVLEAYPT
jgi:Protein of unknown function (DUF4239)